MRSRRASSLRLALACVALWPIAATLGHARTNQPEPAPPPGVPIDGVQPWPEGPPEAVLQLKDGQVVRGLLESRDDQEVVLRIAGLSTRFPMDHIARVEVLPPVLEQYRAMREAIDPGDAERLLVLAEWLRAREQYEHALAEVERALLADPAHTDAARLRLVLQKQIELRDKSRTGAPDRSRPAPERPRRSSFPTLSPGEINLIKVYEVDLRRPPRLVIPRDTITALLSRYAGDPLLPDTREGREALYRRPPAEILELMFRLRARELYPLVQVVGEPESLERFRKDVHGTWLVNSCATNACHGGAEAGRLRLLNRRPDSEATSYTNFLILERFRTGDGRAMIDYDDPAGSPLVQAGLRRDEATWAHPEVPGWRPVFQGEDDRRFRQAMAWIRAMYRPRPDYPIDYDPPAAEPGPAPAQDPR